MKKTLLVSLAYTMLFFSCTKEETTPTPTTSGTTTATCNSAISFGLELNGDYKDASCNGKDATALNTALTTDRNNSTLKAVNFNGTTAYIETPNESSLHPAFPFTVSFWVNPSDSAAASNHFFQAQIDPSNYYGFWIHAVPTTGAIAANYGDGTGSSSSNRYSALSAVRIRSNRWTHITAVYNSATSIQLYFNGVADNLVTYSGSATSIAYQPTTVTTAKGRIGGYSGITTTYYNGKMDKIKIWPKALSSTEVVTEYSATN